MTASETIDSAHGYVRMVLPLMAKYEVPITPQNYAVWYKHVAGEDRELSSTIQKFINNNTTFSSEINKKLYWRYCAEKDEISLKKIRESIQKILVAVFNEIVGMNGHTQQYENVILSSVSKLSEEIPAEEICNIVSQIVEHTKEMLNFGKSLQQKLEQANAELEIVKEEFEQARIESLMDFLTGISNRKAFNEMLTRTIREANKNKTNLCLLIIDIDHFKVFNDKHGHIIGDKVLKFVAEKLKELVKGKDFIARFGGEEFAVILPLTDISGARSAAKNVQEYFEKAKLKIAAMTGELGTITVSIGVARYHRNEPAEKLIKRADQALYHAKNNGRNRVATERDLA